MPAKTRFDALLLADNRSLGSTKQHRSGHGDCGRGTGMADFTTSSTIRRRSVLWAERQFPAIRGSARRHIAPHLAEWRESDWPEPGSACGLVVFRTQDREDCLLLYDEDPQLDANDYKQQRNKETKHGHSPLSGSVIQRSGKRKCQRWALTPQQRARALSGAEAH
jgi:hypothetical protein